MDAGSADAEGGGVATSSSPQPSRRPSRYAECAFRRLGFLDGADVFLAVREGERGEVLRQAGLLQGGGEILRHIDLAGRGVEFKRYLNLVVRLHAGRVAMLLRQRQEIAAAVDSDGAAIAVALDGDRDLVLLAWPERSDDLFGDFDPRRIHPFGLMHSGLEFRHAMLPVSRDIRRGCCRIEALP